MAAGSAAEGGILEDAMAAHIRGHDARVTDRSGSAIEEIPVEDGDVREPPDLDGARVVEVVHVRRARGERRKGIHEIESLVRQQRGLRAAIEVRYALDGDLHLEKW